MRQKAGEEAAAVGTAMHDNLHLMAIAAGGMSRTIYMGLV